MSKLRLPDIDDVESTRYAVEEALLDRRLLLEVLGVSEREWDCLRVRAELAPEALFRELAAARDVEPGEGARAIEFYRRIKELL